MKCGGLAEEQIIVLREHDAGAKKAELRNHLEAPL
jgi:hypothetical protein